MLVSSFVVKPHVVNKLRSETICSNSTREVISDQNVILTRFLDYLGDESKLKAERIAAISFPNSVEQLSEIVAECNKTDSLITVSGARTGIVGAAVPEPHSYLISLEKLKSIEGIFYDETSGQYFLKVGAGVTLRELTEFVSQQNDKYYFPVDPTETSASFGGMVSTDASGARSYRYGSVRNWIRFVRLVLSDGSVLRIKRGEVAARDGYLSLDDSISERALYLAEIHKPKTKNTIGYCFNSSIDPIDIFIGSEGTLGIFTDFEVLLAPKPSHRLFYIQFFVDDETALSFVELVRLSLRECLLAIEYFDLNSISYLRQSNVWKTNAVARAVGDGLAAAVYLEFGFEEEDKLSALYEELEKILSQIGAVQDCSYAGVGERELREIKEFRHALPEHINSIIASRRRLIPGLHKVSTDMAVTDDFLKEIYMYYKSTLEKHRLEYVIFGHAGNNHFHVNILPRDLRELNLAKELYCEFAKYAVCSGGAVAAEHGIGRLKKPFLKIQYDQNSLDRMRAIKQFFDPKLLLNRGVLLD